MKPLLTSLLLLALVGVAQAERPPAPVETAEVLELDVADARSFVGTVVPSGSTTDGTSAQELAELTEVIEQQGVPAIFAETTTSDELAQTLAAEVGDDIAVVELYTGSLGEPGSDGDTYVAMTRTNAQRIADALAG